MMAAFHWRIWVFEFDGRISVHMFLNSFWNRFRLRFHLNENGWIISSRSGDPHEGQKRHWRIGDLETMTWTWSQRLPNSVDPTQKRTVVCRVVNAFFTYIYMYKDCFGEHRFLGSMIVSGQCTYIRFVISLFGSKNCRFGDTAAFPGGGIFDFQGIWVRTVDDERIQVGMKCLCFCVYIYTYNISFPFLGWFQSFSNSGEYLHVSHQHPDRPRCVEVGTVSGSRLSWLQFLIHWVVQSFI